MIRKLHCILCVIMICIMAFTIVACGSKAEEAKVETERIIIMDNTEKIILIGGLIALIALALFAFLCIRYVKKVQNIPRLETEGTLIKVYFVSRKEDGTMFDIKYYVDGKEYVGFLSTAGAKGLSMDTPVGTKVVVLYNPDNPQDAYCELRDRSQLVNK